MDRGNDPLAVYNLFSLPVEWVIIQFDLSATSTTTVTAVTLSPWLLCFLSAPLLKCCWNRQRSEQLVKDNLYSLNLSLRRYPRIGVWTCRCPNFEWNGFKGAFEITIGTRREAPYHSLIITAESFTHPSVYLFAHVSQACLQKRIWMIMTSGGSTGKRLRALSSIATFHDFHRVRTYTQQWLWNSEEQI